MSRKSAPAAPTSDRLTWAEICRLHPDERVTLVDIDWLDESSFEFRSATVIGHGVRRAEALAHARGRLPEFAEFGCFFTGALRGSVPRPAAP